MLASDPVKYFYLGQALSGLLKKRGQNENDIKWIQATLLDLLGEDTALLPPLRDVCSRPGFQSLIIPNDLSSVVACKDALVGELSLIYGPAAVLRLGEFLNGVAGLQSELDNASYMTNNEVLGSGPVDTSFSRKDSQQAQSSDFISSPSTSLQSDTLYSARQISLKLPALTNILIAVVASLCGALVGSAWWMIYTNDKLVKQRGGDISQQNQLNRNHTPDLNRSKKDFADPIPPSPDSPNDPKSRGIELQRDVNDPLSSSQASQNGVCWYSKGHASTLEEYGCSITTRQNARGDRVIEVKWDDGERSNYVFRPNGSVESWFNGKKDYGTYQKLQFQGQRMVRIDAIKDRDVTWLPESVVNQP